MDIIQIPCNPKNYGSTRSLDAIQYIVIHYTGNDGDTAQNNGNFFKNNVREASCHYFVDSKDVVQSVPDDRVAWHCGAKTYYHPNARNSNSIGVELCDDYRNGKVYPSQATIDCTLELVRLIMDKYHVPQERVIRHWDVSHKLCPAYWCGSIDNDILWHTAFLDKLKKEAVIVETRYNTLAEIKRDCPWAVPTVEKLLRHQYILGYGSGLDLSRDMLRVLVINDRAGCYGD